jgi:integrase
LVPPQVSGRQYRVSLETTDESEASRKPWPVTRVKSYVMRHTFASLLAIAGVSIVKIAEWLGDDVKVVERHYAHLLPQDLDIERAFGNSKHRRQHT